MGSFPATAFGRSPPGLVCLAARVGCVRTGRYAAVRQFGAARGHRRGFRHTHPCARDPERERLTVSSQGRRARGSRSLYKSASPSLVAGTLVLTGARSAQGAAPRFRRRLNPGYGSSARAAPVRGFRGTRVNRSRMTRSAPACLSSKATGSLRQINHHPYRIFPRLRFWQPLWCRFPARPVLPPSF
jgi:hypothetical protein